MAKVTIQDVARVAGVSVATVDRVLNRRPGVRGVTVNKVETAIRDLNYQPDRIAARLARSREYRFCFVLPGYNVRATEINASIGIEQTGYAEFNRDDWLTPDGSAQLDLLVSLVGSLCDRYGIPRQWLEADGLTARQPGITSHRLCSESGIGTDHWDPGYNWPVDEFMSRLTGTNPRPCGRFLPQDDDDMIDRYFMRASNDPAVYLVSPGLGWRWHVPAGQMANIVFVLGLNKGKILAPPSNVKIDIVEGQKVWVCSPDFLNAIPAA
jgi:hypothetical protein